MDLRSTRIAISRQLGFLFIYPTVYICLWIPAFVNQLSSIQRLPYLSSAMLVSAVDACYRQYPGWSRCRNLHVERTALAIDQVSSTKVCGKLAARVTKGLSTAKLAEDSMSHSPTGGLDRSPKRKLVGS